MNKIVLFNLHPDLTKSFTEDIQWLNGMKDKFILDENNNVIPANLMEWAVFREDRNKTIVKQELVGRKWISTVFVGIDMAFCEDTKHLFETMVFTKKNGGTDIFCDRYATWDEALKGHAKAVLWVKEGCPDNEDDS